MQVFRVFQVSRIVDANADFLQILLAEYAAHQIDDDERCTDHAGKSGAALRHCIERHAVAIDRQTHCEAGMLPRIMSERDDARGGGEPGIARALERGEPHRVAGKIQSERRLVAGHRFHIFDHHVFRPLAGRVDRKVGIAAGIDAGVASHHRFERLLL
ncbi:hypothetical protein D3C83_14910 [compost metagenome]